MISNVCVQGLGFVGSAMAVAVADARSLDGTPCYQVVGVDRDTKEGRRRVASLNTGHFPFSSVDKKLLEATENAHNSNNLCATIDEDVYSVADIIVVDIGLDIPFTDEIPQLEMVDFENALRSVFARAKPGSLVLIETTVPPGTCEKLIAPIKSEVLRLRGLPEDAVFLAHSFERVMPGNSYLDSIKNYWRVYAGETPEAARKCRVFLENVINTEEYPLTHLTSMTASETAKVMENTYRAVNIAFIDEWTKYAETVGIDLFEIIDAIRKRPTHNNMMFPGLGVGGYCLTKDPAFAPAATRQLFKCEQNEFPFSRLAINVNQQMPCHSFDRLSELFCGQLQRIRILIMGVSYRQNVGDTRYTPVELLVRLLEEQSAIVSIYDPLVEEWPEMRRDILKELPQADDYDAVVFSVPHDQFRKIVLADWLKDSNSLILDACNVLSAAARTQCRQMGNQVESIGRGKGL